MKENELPFDKNRHVLYSKTCRSIVRKRLYLHYSENEIEEIWSKIQLAYLDYLNRWNKDLGGKKNFHNGEGGTYDCILILTYYSVCKNVTSFSEIEKMEEELILPSFKKLRFVNCNKPFFLKLMHTAFSVAESKCAKWNDYKMKVSPYEKGKPIRYEFTSCPVAEFAKEFHLEEIMPALCNVDYVSMELLHAKLIRKGTLMDSNCCDYAICGDEDAYVKEHQEFKDEKGFRRNK